MVTVVCVSVCVFLSLAAFPHYCTDPYVNWENDRGCSVVVYHWADLQSVHGFHCCVNIAPNAKFQRVLVLALCLVVSRGAHPAISCLISGHLRNLRKFEIIII